MDSTDTWFLAIKVCIQQSAGTGGGTLVLAYLFIGMCPSPNHTLEFIISNNSNRNSKATSKNIAMVALTTPSSPILLYCKAALVSLYLEIQSQNETVQVMN